MDEIDVAHRQGGHALRHDWGLGGAAATTAGADVAVVVDVLSFTTTLSVAADAGIAVLPHRWADATAAGFAAEHDAVLAAPRSAAGTDRISLSPASVRRADPPPARLVLPSPNGSTIAHRLGGEVPVVVGACLRDATAVAAWITRHRRRTTTVAVVSAGERWTDGSLRPAVEDLWGAGAVLVGLADRGWDDLSPEAVVAREAFRAVAPHLHEALARCASGLELITRGHGEDVEIAAELDRSDAVPVLDGAAFRRA